jgi:hypothetical protein
MSFPTSMVEVNEVNGVNGVNGDAVTLTLLHARAALTAYTSLAPRKLGPEKTPMELAFGEPGLATTFAPHGPDLGA